MTEITLFQGKKVIILKRSAEDKFPMSFGLSKARLILDNIDDVKKFVKENSTDETAKK